MLPYLEEFFSNQSEVINWGIASANSSPNAGRLKEWIDQGYHGSMAYMANGLQARMRPQELHPWAKSIIVFAIPYARPLQIKKNPKQKISEESIPPAEDKAISYQVAAYVGVEDYHHRARIILQAAQKFLQEKTENPSLNFYGFVDTAPVFERDLASEAGLGWRGKNCCTLNRKDGSAFHLAGFFLDQELIPSQPLEEFCGGCTLCIDQCPTSAFIAPGKLDSNKCISYWTIEAKGLLPEKVAENFGSWIFGCDICQEVCPWNHKAHRSQGENKNPPVSLTLPSSGLEWLALLKKGGGFQSRFKKTPLSRAGRKSLLRNVANAAANQKDFSVLNALIEILKIEEDENLKKDLAQSIKRLGG